MRVERARADGERRTLRAGEVAGLRRDPSGELRGAMRRLIAEGEALESRLYVSEQADPDRDLDSIERWRIGCVTLVASAFEQEAVTELVRATSNARRPPRARTRAQAQRLRVRAALELLDALEGTLKGHGAPDGEQKRRRPSPVPG